MATFLRRHSKGAFGLIGAPINELGKRSAMAQAPIDKCILRGLD
jgi:hypothetical protein